jgi:pyruvate kinase
MLAMVWGVTAVCGEQRGNIEERYDGAVEAAREAGLIEKGDRVILTGGSIGATPGSTNMLKLHTTGEEE